jgi:hypothetical protein
MSPLQNAQAAGSSPAKRGRGTMRSMVEGAGTFARLPAFGATPPASQGESRERVR